MFGNSFKVPSSLGLSWGLLFPEYYFFPSLKTWPSLLLLGWLFFPSPQTHCRACAGMARLQKTKELREQPDFDFYSRKPKKKESGYKNISESLFLSQACFVLWKYLSSFFGAKKRSSLAVTAHSARTLIYCTLVSLSVNFQLKHLSLLCGEGRLLFRLSKPQRKKGILRWDLRGKRRLWETLVW